jgi:Putative restriction endonuclease
MVRTHADGPRVRELAHLACEARLIERNRHETGTSFHAKLVPFMPTLVLDPPPAEIEALLERRRRLGQDRRDETWEGVLHMAPAPLRRHARLQMQIGALLEPLARLAGLEAVAEFNLGSPDDYRIPDCGLLAPGPDELYLSTAALVVEVLSPGEDALQKLPFYVKHEVDEVLIVDPEKRAIDWRALDAGTGTYQAIERSALIELGPAELTERIDWP